MTSFGQRKKCPICGTTFRPRVYYRKAWTEGKPQVVCSVTCRRALRDDLYGPRPGSIAYQAMALVFRAGKRGITTREIAAELSVTPKQVQTKIWCHTQNANPLIRKALDEAPRCVGVLRYWMTARGDTWWRARHKLPIVHIAEETVEPTPQPTADTVSYISTYQKGFTAGYNAAVRDLYKTQDIRDFYNRTTQQATTKEEQ